MGYFQLSANQIIDQIEGHFSQMGSIDPYYDRSDYVDRLCVALEDILGTDVYLAIKRA